MKAFPRCFALLSALLLATLHTAPLFDLDETIYAQAAHEMRATGHWLAPTVNGEPFFEKPLAFYWLLMLAFSLFGEHAWSARLISALATILTAFLIARLLAPILGRARAQLAALVFLVTFQVQMLARAAILDATLNACIAASLLFYLRWLLFAQKRDAIASAAAAGLGVAIKGPVGVVVPGLVVLLERLLFGGHRAVVDLVRRFPWPAALAAFLLTALPEYLLIAWQEGAAFFVDFFVRHNLARATSPMQGHGGGWHYYLVVFLIGGLPWSLAVVVAVVRGWKVRTENTAEAAALRLALVWIVAVLVLFSLVRTKLPHYISSIWPAAAIAVACAPSRRGLRLGAGIVGLLALLLAALPWLWPKIVASAQHPRVVAALADAAPPSAMFALWGIGLLVFALIAVLRPAVQSGIGLGAALGLVLALALAPLVARVQQAPLLAIASKLQAISPDVPVYSFALQAPSVSFYAQRTYRLLHAPEEVASLRPPYLLFLRAENQRRLPEALLQRTPLLSQGGYLLYWVKE